MSNFQSNEESNQSAKNENRKIPSNASEKYVLDPSNYESEKDYFILLQNNLILQQQTIIDKLTAKLPKIEKTDSEEKDLKNLSIRTKYVKIFLSISFAITVVVGIAFLIMFYTQKTQDSDHISDESGGDQYVGDHQILEKNKWNGRPAKFFTPMKSPVSMVIIKHTGGGFCESFLECTGKVQSIQSTAVSNGAGDIYYSFLIGGDGNIYVGRGWNVQPQQRNNTIDIAFMGSYSFDTPTLGMIEATQLLLEDGVKKSKLTKDYILVAHNQTTATESPDNAFGSSSSDLDMKNWWIIHLKGRKLDICNNKKYVAIIMLFLLLIISAIVTYVILENKTEEEIKNNGEYLGPHRIYTKEDWGGQPPRSTVALPHPTGVVIISHSATATCSTFSICSSRARSFQNTHMDNNSPDVGYNFMIGGDSGIYVGRGWDVRNFHMANSIGINFIGEFNTDELTNEMIDAAKLLIQHGVDLGKLNTTYILVGHNQTSANVPKSPGENAYREIKGWPHFSDIILF